MSDRASEELSDKRVERVARAIAHMIPLDSGSRWNPGYGLDFPREYSESEKLLIRGIARTALHADAVSERVSK